MPPREMFQFGRYELDPDAAELRRDGRPVRLQPQPFKLLALIVRRAGTVVSREEIRTELWPDGTFVDFDQAVNFAIKQVRDAIGDSAERPLYVQTIPKRGYRFIAPVEVPRARGDQGMGARPAGATSVRLQKALWANIADLRMAQERQKRLIVIGVISGAAIVVAGVLGYFMFLK